MSTAVERPVLGGTDGFRAEATDQAGPGLMNPETVAGLTWELISYQRETGYDGPLVTAQDPRFSGAALREASIAAALKAGVEVRDAGIVPTPAAQKIAGHLGAMATVVITASHNPWQYNGWKGMLGNRKPTEQENKIISDRYWQRVDSGLSVPSTLDKPHGTERAMWSHWYAGEVERDIVREFGKLPLAGKLFVIDGAHGAARKITNEIFRRLGAQTETFACDNEGLINDGCGAAELGGLKEFLNYRRDIVANPDFVGALANDGDADRVMGIGIDKNGQPVEFTGNHMMELMASNPAQPGIVGTIYTNSGMTGRLKEKGIGFEYCKNGDAFVTNALLAKQAAGENWQRGGEFTGHIIDTSWLTSGDGVRTAAWLAAYAVQSGQTFGELYQQMPLWPETMVKIELPDGMKINIENSKFVQAALEKVKSRGVRPIVRASGTEPVIRAWCEAPDIDLVNDAAMELRTSVAAELMAHAG